MRDRHGGRESVKGAPPGSRGRRTRAPRARGAGRAVLLALACATMAAPFLWMAATSLMGQLEVFSSGRILPATPLWSNYPEALTAQPFARYFVNSLVFSVAVVAGQVATAAAAGYAFARLDFPGRDKVFMLFLSTMMVPAVIVLIPRFLMIDALGWIDSYQGLISTELVSVWGIFLMRQYFRTVPRELEDAARVDGAGPLRIFWSVALPLAKPAVATLGLFAFVDAWKNFLWPLLVTRSMEMRVVEVGIAAFHSTYEINWPYQMAAGVAAVLPIALLFLFTQRYFVRGIQLEGIR